MFLDLLLIMPGPLRTKAVTIIAILSSISAVLMFFDFPLPLFPSFMKMDFSDLPALLGAFSLGPMAGVAIQLIKNLIHLMRTSTGGVGELANFLIGSAFVFSAGLVYKYHKTRRGAIVGMFVGTIAMATVAIAANFFILIPFYTTLMPLERIIAMASRIFPAVDSLDKVVFYSILPFNLIKGAIVSLVTFFIYKKLSVIISEY